MVGLKMGVIGTETGVIGTETGATREGGRVTQGQKKARAGGSG